MPADLTGAQVRSLREELGWTRRQLGEALKLRANPIQRIYELEAGRVGIGPGMAARIREALRGETT